MYKMGLIKLIRGRDESYQVFVKYLSFSKCPLKGR